MAGAEGASDCARRRYAVSFSLSRGSYLFCLLGGVVSAVKLSGLRLYIAAKVEASGFVRIEVELLERGCKLSDF
jgi:hypothetical protein